MPPTKTKVEDFVVPSDEQVRAKFHQLSEEVAKIRKELAPVSEEYEKLSQQAEKFMLEKVRPVREKKLRLIAESGLYEKEQQLGALNRFLKFQTALPEHKDAASPGPAAQEPAG